MKATFNAKLSKWPGDSGWYYVYLPKPLSADIKEVSSSHPKRGFGAIKVQAVIGSTTWATSVFPDASTEQYILFIKKSVRQTEQLTLGDTMKIIIAVVRQ